jgi:hypothetical protein
MIKELTDLQYSSRLRDEIRQLSENNPSVKRLKKTIGIRSRVEKRYWISLFVFVIASANCSRSQVIDL